MAFRFLRFFLQADDAAVGTKLHHAVTLGIAHLIAENAGAVFEREGFAKEIELPVEDVVAQDQRRRRRRRQNLRR